MAKGKYSDWVTGDGLIKVEGWAKDGLTDIQISENIGINRDTLYSWKNSFPEFRDALKRGKEVTDRHVENALLKNALGYRYKEVVEEPFLNPETGKEEMRVVRIITKERAADITAIIFWLKNRKDEWRDKRHLEHSGSIMDLSKWTDEELKKAIDRFEVSESRVD